MRKLNTIDFQKNNKIGILTLNRPESLNAISPELYLEIHEVMKESAFDPEVSVVIITGAGDKAFCAGADIEDMKKMTPYEARRFAGYGLEAFKAINRSPKPVIAAVNGLALGGGCELALACDMVISSTKGRFGLPELNLGVIPGAGGTQRLTRLVGPMRAKELILTGKIIKPEEALQMGIINRVVLPEGLIDSVMEVASVISEKGPIAIHMAKMAINQAQELNLSSGLDYEIECFSSLFATDDQEEGMAAFIEKRKPQYQGK